MLNILKSFLGAIAAIPLLLIGLLCIAVARAIAFVVGVKFYATNLDEFAEFDRTPMGPFLILKDAQGKYLETIELNQDEAKTVERVGNSSIKIKISKNN